MRPHVIVSNAVSPNGSLTGYAVDYGVYYPHLLAYHPDAVLVGADTILAAPVTIPPKNRLILGKDQKGLMRPGRGG